MGRTGSPVNYGTKLPLVYPDTFTLRAAAAGNERLLLHGFQRADILQYEILSIALGKKLRSSQAAGHPFTSLHRVRIERTGKPCSPAGINIRPHQRDITGMMAERDREIAKKPVRIPAGGYRLIGSDGEERHHRHVP